MLGKNGNLSCGVPLAQRIARWTSNPKVLGSIPRWDEKNFWLVLGAELFFSMLMLNFGDLQ